jgi:hypothetical protein
MIDVNTGVEGSTGLNKKPGVETPGSKPKLV